MSRIGKKPIIMPENVIAEINGQKIIIKGPKGVMERSVLPEIKVEIKEGSIVLSKQIKTKKTEAFWGLERSIVQNMVIGVSEGFKKELEIRGIGYKVKKEGDNLVFELGFSHVITMKIPEDVEIAVKHKIITVSGIDKVKVGQTAAKIKGYKRPDPYKGKGIRYLGETIRLKPGKKATTA